MEIIINDEYRIRSASQYWALERRTLIETGSRKDEERWTVIAFWSNLRQLAEGYADYRARISYAEATLPDLAAVFAELIQEINVAIEQIPDAWHPGLRPKHSDPLAPGGRLHGRKAGRRLVSRT